MGGGTKAQEGVFDGMMWRGRDINDVHLQDAMLAANFEPEIEDGTAEMEDTTNKGALKRDGVQNRRTIMTLSPINENGSK